MYFVIFVSIIKHLVTLSSIIIVVTIRLEPYWKVQSVQSAYINARVEITCIKFSPSLIAILDCGQLRMLLLQNFLFLSIKGTLLFILIIMCTIINIERGISTFQIHEQRLS